MECALFPARTALHVHTSHADGWRLGFVQGGDVLLHKKPRADASNLDFFTLAKDLRADAFVGRVGGDDAAPELQDPFRFRWWLGAATCRIAGFETLRPRLADAIPDYLRRNLHGLSAGELLFHLFLTYLHDAGALELPAPAPAIVQRALHDTFRFVEEQSRSSGDHLVMVVTSGRTLVAAARDYPVHYLTIRGLHDCPVCHDRRLAPPNGRRISHESLRAVVVEASPGHPSRPGWQPLPESQCLVVGADRSPSVVPL